MKKQYYIVLKVKHLKHLNWIFYLPKILCFIWVWKCHNNMSELFGHKSIRTRRDVVPKLHVLAVQDRHSDFIIAKKLLQFPLATWISVTVCLETSLGFFSVKEYLLPEVRKQALLVSCLDIEVRVYHMHFLSLIAAIRMFFQCNRTFSWPKSA